MDGEVDIGERVHLFAFKGLIDLADIAAKYRRRRGGMRCDEVR